MAVKTRSRREKIGSGLGLLLGIFIFNLIAYQFVETKALSEANRMIGAIISALLCSELGARVGKWLDRREQS
jgi:ABC-type antimicrobial peptide transport system permease subunit